MSGRVLLGRYRLETELATGKVFTLWRAADDVLNRPVILKIPHKHLAEDDAFRERFESSARSAAALVHPNIVAVYDTGEEDGIPFIVMEYLGGGTLRESLTRGAIGVHEVITLAADVAAGLAHAHGHGLTHGNLTPTNILFTDKHRAKVGDFGLTTSSVT